MKHLLPLFLWLFTAMMMAAQNPAADYDRLSRLSSETLMEEGRKYFADRLPEEALSRFLVVWGRYSDNASGHDKELSVRALNNAACVYKYLYYNYPQAFDYLNKAYTLCIENGYDSFLPVIMVNMGDILSDYGNAYDSPTFRQEAEKMFRECFRKSLQNKDWELLTTSFFNLANLQFDINLKDYSEIFSSEIPADTPDIEYIRLQYRGIQNLQQGNYETARKCFEDQLNAITTHLESSRDSIASYIGIAETYKRERNLPQAAAQLEKALNVADNVETIELAANISYQLADIYEQMGDTVTAQKYHHIALEKREQLHHAHLSHIGELKYFTDLEKEQLNAKKIALRNRLLMVIVSALVALLVIILVAIFLIIRHNRILRNKNRFLFDKYQEAMGTEERAQTKYTRSRLDNDKKEDLIKRIDEIMGQPDQISDGEFSIKQLAQLAGSNTTYVSQVINETYGTSFSNMLGSARIRLACTRINDGNQYKNFTIEGIANSVGFKSRTAFINAFKREVGLTPSQYIKIAGSKQ